MADGPTARGSPGENSSAIDAAVVERVADRTDVPASDLATDLVVVGADLTDAHHEFEQKYEYATVDDIRVYAADESAWAAVVDRNDLAAPGAVRAAHREQAAVLLDGAETGDASDAGDALPGAHPVVVGVDTAEEVDRIPQSGESEDPTT